MNDLMKGMLRSRTVRLGAVMVLAGGAQVALGYYQTYLTPEWQGLITSAVGALIVALRADTREPLAQRGRSDGVL